MMPRLPIRSGIPYVNVNDGTALFQSTKRSGTTTYCELADFYFKIVPSTLKEHDCSKVNIVLISTGQYQSNEESARGEAR